jgi:WD40 repeat protein
VTFYVTGGTLSPGAPSYIARHADVDLFNSLLNGDFCYVLDARQVGKSSLMASTATRLSEFGVTTAVLDLTSVGTNLTIDQWYYGLLVKLTTDLNLGEDVLTYWKGLQELGPLHRWIKTLRERVLPSIHERLVIFVDEIDIVRSLPFSTDEFFAGIRECYNRRSDSPELKKLAFCLVGVATPAELIRSAKMTPFNIGRRVKLADFTLEEAMPLAEELCESSTVSLALLKRVMFWTDGHPYLTQRLCKAIAAEHIYNEAGVDRLCEQLFLSLQARDQDDNLQFVRERLLEAAHDRTKLLLLYQKVRRKRVRTREVPPTLLAELMLTGVVKSDEGVLRVRNRLYGEVFNAQWVLDNLPGAERRRVARAYFSGMLKTAGALGSLVLLLVGVSLYAFNQAAAARLASKQSNATSNAYQALLYDSEILLAGDHLKDDPPGFGAARQILAQVQLDSGPYLNWEWGFLSSVVHPERRSWQFGNPAPVAMSSDSSLFAQFKPASVDLYDQGSGKVTWSIAQAEDSRCISVGGAWLDHDRLIAVNRSAKVDIVDVGKHQIIHTLTPKPGYQVTHIAVSPSTDLVALSEFRSNSQSFLSVYRASDGQQIFREGAPMKSGIHALAFSSDANTLLAGWGKGILHLRMDNMAHEVAEDGRGPYTALATFNNDLGLAISSHNEAIIFDMSIGHVRALRQLPDQKAIDEVAMINGTHFATSCQSGVVNLYDLKEAEPLDSFTADTQEAPNIQLLTSSELLVASPGAAYDWVAKNSERHTPSATTSANPEGLVHGWPALPSNQTAPLGRKLTLSQEHVLDIGATGGKGQLGSLARVYSTAQSEDGRYVGAIQKREGNAVLDEYGNQVLIWDQNSGWRTVETGRNVEFSSLALNASADILVIAAANPSCPSLVYRTSTLELIGEIPAVANVAPCALVISPDGKRLFQGMSDGRVQVWDLTTRRLLLELGRNALGLHLPTDSPHAVARLDLSESGRQLSATFADGATQRWRSVGPQNGS